MLTINIADNKDRAEFAAFAVTSEGDVTWYAEAVKEAEAGFITIHAKVLDDPLYAGTCEQWLYSVKARVAALQKS